MTDRRFVEHRSYNIKQLWELHHNALRMLALGANNKQVADTLGVTAQTISNLRNSPAGRAKLDEFRSMLDQETLDVAQRIQQFAPIALDVIEEVIAGEHPEADITLRVRTASSHLARAGYGEVRKVATLNAHISREEIERIKERAVANARAAGMLSLEADDKA